MQVTASMLNNKVDLSKLNTQFASGKVNPDDSVSATKELNVVDSLLAEDTQDEILDILSVQKKGDFLDKSTVTKVDVAQSLLDTLGSIIEVTAELASECIEGSAIPPEQLQKIVDNWSEFMKEHLNFFLVRHTKLGDGYIFDGETIFGKDRKESSFTVENGDLCYNGVPLNDGIVQKITEKIAEKIEDGTLEHPEQVGEEENVVSDTTFDSSIKSVYTLGFGTDENGMLSNLHSLLDDFASDISVGDMSNMESYLDKLNGYKDSLLTVQADLDYAENPEVAITKYTCQEVAYEACLAMQPNILQPTLSDYVV